MRVAAAWLTVAAALVPAVRAFAQANGDSTHHPDHVTVEVFTNMTGAPSDAWIGTGIAESLAADLSAGSIRRENRTRWHVRGSYQRLGTRIRIIAELVDRSVGRTVDAAKVDGDVSALFALEDELANHMTRALQLATHASETADDDGPVAVAANAGRPPIAPAARPTESARSSGGDGADPSVAGVTGGTAGFALRSTTIIAGPPPPVAPEVASRDAEGRMTLRAVRLDTPLQVDGQLDERVYQAVPPVTDFIQQEPDEGAAATERTEAWVMFDGDTLYISARCSSSEPDQIVANEMKRDSFGMFGNETFSVVLDTFYDRRNGFNFMTNALGGLFDATITNERTPNMDWNTVWEVKTGRSEQGWTVEMAIPFRSLRYRAGGQQVWGINMQRRVASKNEASYLTPIPAALSFAGMFKLSSAATLIGLEIPTSGTRLEVKPYAISDLTTDLNATPLVSNALGGDAGFDIKYGVTQGLTADFTYDTDFAQVEVDEQQVNLTRFSLFFPEKREFFLEGQGIFDFGGGISLSPSAFFFTGERFGGTVPVLFFSRRIGLDDGRTVPIRAGGRLTGKVGPYSIGLLDVQTGEESVSGADATNFSVVRVKRDVLRRSAVGALFTSRSVSTEGNGGNYVYAVDGVFSFYDNLNINTYLARTETPKLRGDDLSYQAQLDYNGDRWGVVVDRLAVGANFNPEVGFVRRGDFRRNFTSFRFSPRPQSLAAVRKFSLEGSLDYTTDGAGLPETRLRQGLFGIEFENGDRFFAGVTDNYEFLKEPFEVARGTEIPVGGYSFLNTRVVYSLGQQRVMSGGLTVERGGFFGGDKTSVGYFLGRIGLSSRLALEPSLSFNWVNLPEGNFTTELVSTRTIYAITPRMFVAALLQFNSGSDSLGTNIRLRWEYQPGSELFVVYTDERDTLTPRFPTLENRAFVIKITRLFRF